MRARKQSLWIVCLLSLASLSVGCGKDDKATTSGGGAEAAGGEAPGDTEAPSGEGGGSGVSKTDSKGTDAKSGSSSTAKTDPQKAKPTGSAWGSPEAESGRPLPARKALTGQAKSSYQDGANSARAGDLAAARKSFEAAVKADAGAYQALYALGVLADREGKESQALDYYRRSLRAQADYELAAEGSVVVYLRQGQPEKARAFIQPLAETWERNLELQSIYANLLTQMGRPQDAIDVARKALRRDEKNVPAMLSLIHANLKAGRLELADSILEQALAIDEKNAELHYLRGRRYMDDSRLAEALTEFKRAVELDPDFADARMELGLRMLAGANYQEALNQFQVVEKLSPKLVEVHLALGDAYRSTKQWDKAKVAFDRALRMKNDLPQAHYDLALMYLTAGAEFPGMDLLTSLAKAKEEFGTYRSMMGSRLTRDDASTAYLDDIEKSIAREQKRIEREQKAKEREAARGARKDGAATEEKK